MKAYRNNGSYKNRGIDYRGRKAKAAKFAVRTAIAAAVPRFKREDVDLPGGRRGSRIVNL